jgi:hypothetical protein
MELRKKVKCLLYTTTTITDEMEWEPTKGKVIGMSLKDRGAILPAGHFANWAFWYSKTGSLFLVLMARSFQTGFRNSMMKSTICLISIKVGT